MSADILLYFAYGSNMLTKRLAGRTDDCRPLGRATLAGHRLSFHKRSKDGSGKANAFRTGDEGDHVIGVVFEIPAAGKPGLDRAEGLNKGYRQKSVRVLLDGIGEVEAFAYTAEPSAIDECLKPTAEYREKVLAGAKEHGLPETYVEEFIRSVEVLKQQNT
jgi:cation transport regulator ChaC